ncbi:ATP-dependent nuclease [Sporolactobacillus terrae]|uniref:AAA domain-containing protein n=1 Tax=Sporolactobacillus terrae TaxID=269673 RepID=A0ABX5Q4L8_9BACL|nr:AAA family ATPase [Sporolactobacillus terrae]QAA21583.1 hypothetical protein C0674_02500 [Sporolactobacillus terrae]QAA24555.1 hypothetical protein C0679_02480 [Sporolactobacillus terrae]
MRISKVRVHNYRNLKNIQIELNQMVVFVGENNSGKSNLLRAITLPFLNDEIGNLSKKLGWHDISNDAKTCYFEYIKQHIEDIKNNEINEEEFVSVIPSVEVEVEFEPSGPEEFYVQHWTDSLDENYPIYMIRYQFAVENPIELLDRVTAIVNEHENIDNLKMNLLPIELFKYCIVIPMKEEAVAYNDLINFKYNSLAAERDEFSNKNSQLGSKALVNLLQNKLNGEQTVEVEKSYKNFFSKLKEISKFDKVFNWQEYSEIENAKEFFDEITLLPNMPSMSSLLNNVRLGYGEDYLQTQGLGYRNLIYLLVMMNSLETNSDLALNILTIEEPEAHLCVSNERLLASFINSVVSKSKQLQFFISTHSSEFLNKLKLENVTVLSEGNALSLKSVLEPDQLDYLAKIPNLDFLKFLFSRRCILVEGPSEEMLIRSYLSLQSNSLNDIEVISLHKGFTKLMDIWRKINDNSSHRIGIIRDFDDQPNAQQTHEAYNSYDNIYVTTTTEYTLEPEFVNTGDNYQKLADYFSGKFGWQNIDDEDKLSDKWRNAKADTMLKFCKDFGKEELEGIELPQHIRKVLTFLQSGEKE